MLHWLVELDLEGRIYRWSVAPVEVDDDHLYRGGLSDLALELGQGSVQLQIADASVDWPTLAPRLQGGRATVRRWLEGEVFDQALVFVDGDIVDVSWDTADAPVVLRVAAESSATRGVPLPDAFSRSGSVTWPEAGGPVVADQGVPYPIIFGYPGYDGDTNPYPIVPVALAQYSATRALTKAIVSEDGDAAITSVRLRNQATDGEATQTCAKATDKLGKKVVIAHFNASTSGYPSSVNEGRALFAGYGPTGGGGIARSAYDVIVYLLRRWGSDTVDWGRLPEVQSLLERYLVDTWIDAPMPDPWTWLEQVLLPDLPIVVRLGPRGRYLAPVTWRPTLDQVVAELEVGRHVAAASRFTLERGGILNEFAAEYREDRQGTYRARVVVTGGDGTDLSVLPSSVPGSTSTTSLSVVRSGRCQLSRTAYGLRRAEVQTIDWTWDEGTVLRVLEDRVEREALPARITSYTVARRLRHDLRENDVVRITDADRGLEDELAVITAPPVVGSESTTITLRIPR